MSTLRSVEVSLYNVLIVLSYAGILLLYVIRYVSFVANFSVIKFVFDNMINDWAVTKNPIETGIFLKHIIVAKRVIVTFIALACLVGAFTTVTIAVPTLCHSKLQLRYLRLYGFFYNEGSQPSDLVCVHLVLITVIGVLSIAGTESAIAVNCAYLCGLLEIASYRIENAVNIMVNSITSEQIDIQSAVELHQRAIELLLLATKDMGNVENLFFSVTLVILQLIVMFLNNYSGQKLKDTSRDVFHKTYNTSWYCIPPRSQKMLLLILTRSLDEVQFDLAGLYTPCYEGFSMMMSSSFSYFTVLYSTQ